MQHSAWSLIIFGIFIALVGLGLVFAPSIPWLGKLPGDIVIDRHETSDSTSRTTCILLSVC